MAQSEGSADGAPVGGDRCSARVVIAGYGPVGRFVVERLGRAGVSLTIVETNLQTIQKQIALERTVVYGDIADPEVMKEAGIEEADVLVLTIPDEACAIRACQLARKLNPDIFIAVRTKHVSGAMMAGRVGANETVIEELVTAQAMGQVVMNRLAGLNEPGQSPD
ncbi:MAG: NAD-binding protein [Phycisphaeraceae bacterium]|nr:NAD-binding protein [Phycisphaeraceae bacterium]